MNAHITRSILFQVAAIVAIVITVRSSDQPATFETRDAYFFNAADAESETDRIATDTHGYQDDGRVPGWTSRNNGSVIANKRLRNHLIHGQKIEDRLLADEVRFAGVVSGSRALSRVDAPCSLNPVLSNCAIPPIEIHERCASCLRGMVFRGFHEPQDMGEQHMCKEDRNLQFIGFRAPNYPEPQAGCGGCVRVTSHKCRRPATAKSMEACRQHSGVVREAREIRQRCDRTTDFTPDCTSECATECPTRIGVEASWSRAGQKMDRAIPVAIASHPDPQVHASGAYGGQRGIRANVQFVGSPRPDNTISAEALHRSGFRFSRTALR